MQSNQSHANNNRVVAHLVGGELIKGTTLDFLPARALFHIQPTGDRAPRQVLVQDLKALFFVRELDGDRGYAPRPGFSPDATAAKSGKKIAVRFKDGELLCGYTLSYSPDRAGFFLVPADSGSNNLRVYVVKQSAAEISVGAAADRVADVCPVEYSPSPSLA